MLVVCAFGLVLAVIVLAFISFAALLTHVALSVWACDWHLLFLGIVFPPLGVAHGASKWFGAF